MGLKTIKYIQIILFLILTVGILPETTFSQETPKKKQLWKSRSFDMALTDRGIAAGGTWNHALNRVYSIPVQFSLLFFKESDKISYYDPYYGYIVPPSKKIVFLNSRTGIQRRLWAQSIAENVQPYIFASLGPSLAVNPLNEGGFFERWKETTFSATGHAFFGLGVDFVYSRLNFFSLSVGYEMIHFFHNVDGSQDYSGFSVVLSFGERL